MATLLLNNYDHGLARPIAGVLRSERKRRGKVLDRLTRPPRAFYCVHPIHVCDSGAQSELGKADSRISGQLRRPTPAAAAPTPFGRVERAENDDAEAGHYAARLRATEGDPEGTAEGRACFAEGRGRLAVTSERCRRWSG